MKQQHLLVVLPAEPAINRQKLRHLADQPAELVTNLPKHQQPVEPATSPLKNRLLAVLLAEPETSKET